MKLKSKKSALLLSFTSLLLCFAMLAGSTFAWFTDTATTGVNQIVSGNLDLEVYHKTSGTSIELEKINGLTNLFDNVEGSPIRWEPGAKAEETFVIKNEGNLALKYCFAVSYANATKTPAGKTLADALTVSTATGEDNFDENRGERKAANTAFEGTQLADFSHEEYLLPGEYREIKMTIQWVPSANDNDFNVAGGLSVDLGINVLATQYTYEKDSISDQYDAQAEYPVLPVKVSTADELKAAIVELNRNGGKMVLELTENISPKVLDIGKGELTVNLNGYTICVGNEFNAEKYGIEISRGAKVTFENGTIESTESWRTIQNSKGDLTLKGVTLKNKATDYAFFTGSNYYFPTCLYVKDGTVTITGGTSITGTRAIYLEHRHYPTVDATSPKVIIDQGMTGTITGKQEAICVDRANNPITDSCDQREAGFIQDLR
ncbi:MAG: SipW-dependent-type signal peptide-containing protein [Clostridia bacterium]|nr:SipW-dependent-type signal peptide-containing protein [Clostridia bacterium]